MKDKINVGVVGLGGRGLSLLKEIVLKSPAVEVLAVCDVYADRTTAGVKVVKAARGNTPFSSADYSDMLKIPEIDAILIFCSWEYHIEIAIAAMKAGKYVGMEVGGAYRLSDCFDLVKTSEDTGMPCMLLENCCYGEYELMVLNMVRKGVFGEVVHCDGGYEHDLRYEISFGKENRHYRLNNYLNRNCENYPTHELGPIAKVLNINRGNRITSLVSVSSKAAGLHEYILKHKSDDKELCSAEFKQGDIINTFLTCEGGQTITLQLDTSLPRFYSRGFTVRGTKAMYQEDGNIIFIDGKHNLFHDKTKMLWNNAKKYARKYSHPIWKNGRKKINRALHSGMDSLVFAAFFEAVKIGENTPIDVYDTATWMAVTALSEQSIEGGNIPVEFPDFTGGKWKNRTDKLKNPFALD